MAKVTVKQQWRAEVATLEGRCRRILKMGEELFGRARPTRKQLTKVKVANRRVALAITHLNDIPMEGR